MATTNNKQYYTISDFEAGRQYAEVNGATVEVLEAEQKEHGVKLFVKFYGGSMLRIDTASTDVYLSDKKKRSLPEWAQTGAEVIDIRDGKHYVIESVGNQRVQLIRYCDIDIRTLFMEFAPAQQQPQVEEWIMTGQKAKHEGFSCEIQEVKGRLAKIRKDYGCNTYTTNWVPASELKRMSTTITAIGEDGEQREEAVFVNDFEPRYNMVTFLLQLLDINNIWDKHLREWYSKRIQRGKSGRTWLFELNGCDYITRAY